MDSTTRPSICVIANPKSGKLRRSHDSVRRLTATVRERATLAMTEDLDGLTAVCRGTAVNRPDRIVVVGGDGTAMHVISALARVHGVESVPPVLLLPFGTVNTTTRRLGVTGTPWDLLEQALEPQLEYCRQPLLRIRVDGSEYLAATLGTGLVSHFFDEYASMRSPGMGAAAQIFAKVFAGSLIGHGYANRILAPVRGRLWIEGREMAMREFTLLVSSVLDNLGLGLRPTYRAKQDPSRVHVVATDLPARRLGPQAWRVCLGKPLVAPNLVDDLVTTFRFEADAPVNLILDGEAVGAQLIEVSAGYTVLVWDRTRTLSH